MPSRKNVSDFIQLFAVLMGLGTCLLAHLSPLGRAIPGIAIFFMPTAFLYAFILRKMFHRHLQ